MLLNLNRNIVVIERQTYSLLEWVGDIGGLFDGLYYIMRFFIVPIATKSMKYELLRHTLIAMDNPDIQKQVN